MPTPHFTWLLHQTSMQNFESILFHNALLTLPEMIEKTIFYKGFTTVESSFDAAIAPQYPGVYFSAKQKEENGTKLMYFDRDNIILAFSTDLLKRNDWHLNSNDHNGFIGDETYVKETLHLYPELSSQLGNDWFVGNELVFHNQVGFQCLIEIWVSNHDTLNKVQEISTLSVPVKKRKTIPLYSSPDVPSYVPAAKFTQQNLCYPWGQRVTPFTVPQSEKEGAMCNCGLGCEYKDQDDQALYQKLAKASTSGIHQKVNRFPPYL